jgi:hypothetical protein
LATCPALVALVTPGSLVSTVTAWEAPRRQARPGFADFLEHEVRHGGSELKFLASIMGR